MVKGSLQVALDFGADPKEPAEHKAVATCGADGKWLVTKSGPTYCNTYEITAFDDAGLKWLQDHEAK